MIGRFTRLWNASIRRQLILGIAAVHALLMSVFVFDLVHRQQTFLLEQGTEQARSLARTLAANGAPWVLSNDIVGIEEVLASMAHYPDLQYAFLLNPEGRVLGHSEQDVAGEYVNDPRSRSLLEGPTEIQVLHRSSRLIDAAAPIRVDGRLVGWARVGLGQQHNTTSLAKVAREGLIYTVVAILLGTLFALLLARRMTQGLYRLLEVVHAVREGRLDQRTRLDRDDEIGDLAGHVDSMLEALETGNRELVSTREQLNLALEGSGTGWWDWNVGTSRAVFSPHWKSMLGYAEDEIDNHVEEWTRRVHPDDLDQAWQDVQAHLAGKTERYENIHRMRHKGGHWVWILDRGLALRDEDGEAVRVVGTHTDITRQVEAEQALSQAHSRLSVTLRSIGDGVITTDSRGRIENMNPHAEKLTGHPLDEARCRDIEEILTLEDEDIGEPLPNPVTTVLARPASTTARDQAWLRAGDSRVPIEYVATPIRDENDRTDGAVIVLHDVSRARQMAREMSWLASHDPLTGLYNRRAFEEELGRMQDTARRDTRLHALLYMDLDQFKVVNDTAGHLAGDELLRQLTRVLPTRLRQSDFLARLGGDEFGLLLKDCDETHATQIAEAIRRTVADFNFHWKDRVFNVGVSIGVVMIDGSAPSMEDLLSNADVACYTAKEKGRNRYHVYRGDDAESGHRHRQIHLVTRIREALNEDRFRLVGQRIQPLNDGPEGDHLEVLVRMEDEQGKLVSPGFFIPAAERYDLMHELDRWVIRAALRELANHFTSTAADTGPQRACINLSGQSLTNPDTLGFICEELESTGLDPARLCFEVTETAAIANLDAATHIMRELRHVGCAFSLDDFGSGLSSFAYLKHLPVDLVKIDGEFVRAIDTDDADRVFVQAINEVAHSLGLRTVAEFVENGEILETTRKLGVDYAQGYHIQRPEDLATVLAGERREQRLSAGTPG